MSISMLITPRRTLAAAVLLALVPGGALAQTAKEAELEARVAQLEAMVQQLMQERSPPAPAATAQAATAQAAQPATASSTPGPPTPSIQATPILPAANAGTTFGFGGFIKLDAMENPYSLSPELQAELGQRLGRLALNRYPDGRVNDLRAALARYADMPAGYDLMLGNGSDELISLLALACDVPGASILAPLPGFVMYAMSAQLQGLAFHGVPLTADFELDEAAMLAAICQHKPTITYIAYPNNPTANLWDEAVIARIIAAVGEQGGLVVMDEAYQPFSSHSWLERIRANALQVRPGRCAAGLHDRPEGAGGRDRQGAATLQHQRAELRVRLVRARTC